MRRAGRWADRFLVFIFVVIALTAAVTPIIVGSAAAATESAPTCSTLGYNGSGTSDEPYEVTNVSQLQCLDGNHSDAASLSDSLGSAYELTSDITATGTAQWNGAHGFDPIGNNSDTFTGEFDGRNYTITNLTVDRPETSYVGLFGEVESGSVRNVTLRNATAEGYDYVGILVGSYNSSDADIRTVTATGTVRSEAKYAGGIAGYLHFKSVRNSSATVNVSGGFGTGGLVGKAYLGSVNDSTARGDVAGANRAGGLVGDVSSVHNSSASGNVTGGTYTGGVAGYVYSDVHNSSAIGSVTGGDETGGLVGKVDVGSIYDASATGDIEGGGETGGLVGEVEAGSIYDASATGDVGGGTYTGGLAGYVYSDVYNASASGSVNTTASSFTGGLVGQVDDGSVYDATASGAVEGGSSTGGLVGEVDSGSVYNASASGDVDGGDYTGGLAGEVETDIHNSSAVGSVTGDGETGGLVGKVDVGSIYDAWATGDVEGGDETGGLVGEVEAGSVFDSTASGDVDGRDYTGGLAGIVYDEIRNSSANGDATGNNRTGGLAGWVQYDVQNGSASGDVDGGNYAGGLVGQMRSGSLYDSSASGNVTGDQWTGGLIGNVYDDSIYNSSASGDVDGGGYTGGLAGYVYDEIRNSSASGAVTSSGNRAGGLVGDVGSVHDSTASGSLTATGDYTYGGLAGYVYQDVTNSSASGNVTATDYTGGLVGYADHAVRNSSATGAVTGHNRTGGLVGHLNTGDTVSRSYATGSVDGNRSVGGLVGNASGSITDAYATGSVAGNSTVGGLVGLLHETTVDRVYAAGTVSAEHRLGGLVGNATAGATVADASWDANTSGVNVSDGGSPEPTTRLVGAAATTTLDAFDYTSTWAVRTGDTRSYPVLRTPRQTPAPGLTGVFNLTVTAANDGNPGDTLDVAVNVTNRGTVTTNHSVRLYSDPANGTVADTTTVSLAPGNHTVRTLSWTPSTDDIGTNVLAVNSTFATTTTGVSVSAETETTPPTLDGGGNSGDSFGSDDSEPDSSTTDGEVIRTITVEETAEVATVPFSEEMPVETVSISGARYPSGTVTVSEFALDSTDGVPPGGTPVAAVDISGPAATDTPATVTLEVDNATLPDSVSGSAVSTARIKHRTDGKWETLNTTMEYSEGAVAFSAETTGFSPFAVVMPEPTATSTTETMSTDDAATQSDDSQLLPGTGLDAALVVAALIALGTVLWLVRT